MTDDLSALEDWAGALLTKLQPKERRQLNTSIARELRRSQQQRIAAQRNPDGTAYAPRKARELRQKQGRIKRKRKAAPMFTKLRQARYLKVQSTANSIAIGFLGRTARIARVHQYGLRDSPGKTSPDTRYDRRELLGFSSSDLDMIRDSLLNHLTR
ncbi:phage virion morphogenesis protein [Pseudomonas marincola]|uniref:phage virion morphogenesis protein n=1 Tax=Pseudomonas marincola TaxID=437900 RepID=UPI0008F3228E|nr:phage virion morphogenesis protein [Pseudomonas marincola]SFT48983.1 phage virion morphogenesis (putative tail completion) protein [Pseudomonas marincola]